MGDGTETRLGTVCEHADEIRGRLSGVDGASSLVDAVIAAAVEDRGVSAALDDLHRALVALGDGAGLHGYAAGAHRVGALNPAPSGIGLPRPASALYRCPQGRCSRTWEPNPAEDPPTCRVGDRPLRAPRRA
ncbi:hypothetical protein Q8791_15230 [Nocardiopsis sp. CT-R113]|uniref:Uncharacterized protein n=1 Tax=Nocardiopsis codii TaxID=3065942 RepID=A0ABU7K8K5_9ACTN|nr:hypothetical protein [Nocardiopsis sp. CT-R113]MEE2038576.1 hypothetical protein [Nocardiopsis sp. CT-R113]